ncbi:protein NirD [Skermanella aerolata]|uniref:siroheme decarboxylase n=1 Tax=Skermanella aerolata TaxID=393310 RepID=A0A512DRP9_9PROT|nr:AsnC family transcriptional regulator [Skermanella aerolata]KJB93164.1 AsnC family transcriptional regulator [Skermanella aerolata KACC 11604]GEO39117.1 protein NirD [Skermanella aerolata]
MDALDQRLLDEFQRGFPLTSRPYAEIATRLEVSEAEVIDRLRRLTDDGAVRRVGAVFRPNRVGASTLAALAVPPERLEDVAGLVGAFAEVNHNYAREHWLNLWFVVTAPDAERVAQVLAEIATLTGLTPLDLRLERDFHVDLGFRLWN